MAELLFRLNGVPDDEAADVRALLEEHAIEFYETTQGNWGVSLAAIWLPNDSQKIEAVSLLESYQQQRSLRSREEYQAGEQISFWQRLLDNPKKIVAYLILVGVLLYISIVPFMGVWQ